MKNNVSLVLIIIFLAFTAPFAFSDDQKKNKAITASAQYLMLIDSAQYEKSWENSATLFKGVVSQDQWVQQISTVRSQLGKLIKRKFKLGNEEQIANLLNDLRSRTLSQPGYVSGMTLISPENTHHSLVIATWKKLPFWHAWRNNKERKDFEDMLEIYQEEPTRYEEYVIGTPFEKH